MSAFGVNIERINKHLLHQAITEFAIEEYSGRIDFISELNEIRRIKIEIYLEPMPPPAHSAVLASIEKNWSAVDAWLGHDNTILSIEFTRGKITSVRGRDITTHNA